MAIQYSCLESSMNRGAWWAAVHGLRRVRRDLVTKQQQLLPIPTTSDASTVPRVLSWRDAV